MALLCISLCFCLAFLLTPSIAWPQWLPGGVPVWATYGQSLPFIVYDGAGGAYIACRDRRTEGNEEDVYAQRLTAAGQVPPGWDPLGLGVATYARLQAVTAVGRASDGAMLIAWRDRRNFLATSEDAYVQKVMPGGSVAPGWPLGGRVIGPLPMPQLPTSVLGDVSGGAFVVWEDERAGTLDVYAIRISADGSTAVGWPSTGIPVCIQPLGQGSAKLAPDGADGAYVVWSDARSGIDVYVQHLTGDGQIFPGWPASGRSITDAVGNQQGFGLCADGEGGLYVGWPDSRSGNLDVYLQRLDAGGGTHAGWPPDGLPICIQPNGQSEVDLIGDAHGGVVMAWEDARGSGASGVYLQRLTSDGTPSAGWPANGRKACTALGLQVLPHLAPDAEGGAYLCYFQPDRDLIRAQHISASGLPALGWSNEAVVLSSRISVQQYPVIAPDGLGGAIVAWEEVGVGYDQVFAQRLVPDGPVPTALDLASSDVTAERVRLVWHSSGGGQRVQLERRTEVGQWTNLAELLPDGSGNYTYEDQAIEPGERYGYRLAFESGAGTQYTREEWVSVPALRFALQGLVPNPARRSALNVAFTLARAGEAELSLYDLAGRRVVAQPLGSLAAGTHRERLSTDRTLAPGIYWLRLQQGADVATSRAVVVD